MKIRMSFTYDCPLNTQLDEFLIDLAKRIGFEWWGQGADLPTQTRDLLFDAEFADSAFSGEEGNGE